MMNRGVGVSVYSLGIGQSGNNIMSIQSNNLIMKNCSFPVLLSFSLALIIRSFTSSQCIL